MAICEYLLIAGLLLFAAATAQAAAPVRIENARMALEFDPATGAWTGLVDKATGDNLAGGPAAGVPVGLSVPRLDLAALEAAVAAGKAISVEGTWRFAAEPKEADPARLAAPGLDDKAWETTPVPSRADAGDRRLQDRVGAFWYRTTATPPGAWSGRDLALVIGAVDDFDTTYFNGEQIGITDAGTPRHWETPRRYVIPARRVRFGQPNTLAVRAFNGAFAGGILGPVRLGLAEALPEPAAAVALVSHKPSADGRTLDMTLRAGPWLVHVVSRGENARMTGDSSHTAGRGIVDFTPQVQPFWARFHQGRGNTRALLRPRVQGVEAGILHPERPKNMPSVRPIHEAVSLRPPAGGLERLAEKVLYCGHPGGMPEKGFRGYGGFKVLEAYLPTLRKMGVDLLWLLPIFEHGDGVKWNLYSPFDHFRISPLYGTPEELKSLSASAERAGIRLMFDLVPHGPPDSTPLAKAHPEWVCLDEAGKPTYVWGQLAFDNAHPGWQDSMRRAAEHNAREYGAVGARVDVASGSPPNWDPRAGYRPSHSTLGGGLGMDRAIREGFLRVHKTVLLLPEEYTGANIFYRDADLTYDCQLFFLLVDLQATQAPPDEWAERLQRFLHDQSLTLPPGAIKMRWTANHDTVSWTFQKKRTRDAYGPERARALLALSCLIGGAPMIYQGEEDPALYGGKGDSLVEDIARLIACRKRLPALARGTADYQAVRASGGVFACLRELGDGRALVLVSFNPKPVTSALALPAPVRSVQRWKDELTGEELSASAVPMANHQVRVLAPIR
ncbi:MAG: alpha-amylase family glycosyl hydrolase [Planctomycetota bacterium]|nr:alpha-amylase family glycosyl hydrolase [Planctomycetota bacterium]